MKKSLLSILALALVAVGCQNYDDQFSNIESQITALASQVAGLSQVQSDLTALGNTVNSLQSSVGDTVNAALADGLADIDAAVASLEAATATAANFNLTFDFSNRFDGSLCGCSRLHLLFLDLPCPLFSSDAALDL